MRESGFGQGFSYVYSAIKIECNSCLWMVDVLNIFFITTTLTAVVKFFKRQKERERECKYEPVTDPQNVGNNRIAGTALYKSFKALCSYAKWSLLIRVKLL